MPPRLKPTVIIDDVNPHPVFCQGNCITLILTAVTPRKDAAQPLHCRSLLFTLLQRCKWTCQKRMRAHVTFLKMSALFTTPEVAKAHTRILIAALFATQNLKLQAGSPSSAGRTHKSWRIRTMEYLTARIKWHEPCKQNGEHKRRSQTQKGTN